MISHWKVKAVKSFPVEDKDPFIPWLLMNHDDVIKWKHFPRNWPFVRGIHRSPANSPHKGQWRGALMFFFYLRLIKRFSKQSWGWWFETPASSLWRHGNAAGAKCQRIGLVIPEYCGFSTGRVNKKHSFMPMVVTTKQRTFRTSFTTNVWHAMLSLE